MDMSPSVEGLYTRTLMLRESITRKVSYHMNGKPQHWLKYLLSR